MKTLGRHLLIEFYDCDTSILNEPEAIEAMMKKAAVESGATIVSVHTNLFNPHGVSGVVVIAESHITIHTWPELGYASVDAFTCGDSVDPWKIKDCLESTLKSKRVEAIELKRGLFSPAQLAKNFGTQDFYTTK
jgi:S-adenosylmethionine decarboxylase